MAIAACAIPVPRRVIAPAPRRAPPPVAVVTSTPAVEAPPPPVPTSHRFAVVAEHEAASRVALAVLGRGGSAVDAAIAAMLAMGVVHPASSGIGGGGIGLIWSAKDKQATVVDFRETAPMGIRPAEYDVRPLANKRRGALVGVPGELAGIAEMHRRWGKLPLGDLLRAAADVAEQGFTVSHHQERAMRWRDKWLLHDAVMAGVLAPEGKLLHAGNTAKNATLASTLRTLADEGIESLYRGKLAQEIVAATRKLGGQLTAADLERYQAIVREPLRVDWAQKVVLVAPPPSAGGLLLAETLDMHDAATLAKLEYQSGSYFHFLAETFRGAIVDRMRLIGDPAYIKMDLAALRSPARTSERRSRIQLDKTRRPERFRIDETGTSQVIAVDDEGSVASVTTSLRSMFGARIVTPSGIVLNDALSDFTTARIDRAFRAGIHPNAARGGARPVTSMTPVLVVEGQRVILALGGAGGFDIPTAVTQALLARLVFGRSAQQCVADARVRTPPDGGLWLAPGSDEALIADLGKRGEIVRADVPDYSAVELVTLDERSGRVLEAVSDPRKGGAPLVE
jgi:gamma-glutamyltranspeptidase/glutathione hydrolase